MDKFSYLNQIRGIAKAKRDQLCPPQTATLVKAGKLLAQLTAASGQCEAMGHPLSKEFRKTLAEVIRDMRSFQSGYASNDPSQQIDDLAAAPAFAETNTVKVDSAEKRVTVAEFGVYSLNLIKSVEGLDVPEALASLDAFLALVDKAILDADVSGVLLPAQNDPAQVKTTVSNGAVTSLAGGTSAPSTASSNFATNPEAANGAPPSSMPASTGAAAAAAASNTVTDPTVVPAPAGPGPAASTGNVATAATAAGGGDTQAFKAATAPAAEPTPEEIAKAAAGASNPVGWTRDLNTREFMTGKRRVDFGKDGSK